MKRNTIAAAALLAAALGLTLVVTSGDLLTYATAAEPMATALDLPTVAVTAVESRAVAPESTFIARAEAAERVALRPRVAGHVEAVLFQDGQFVKAGQPLFTIDARAFDAALASAQAQLKLAQAREQRAVGEARRARELLALDAIAAEEAERRSAALAEAQAQVAAAQAALRAAKLDREFATVRAPIDGRIGRALVTTGNYVDVGASQAPLAVLLSSQSLQVHFDVADPAIQAHLARARKPDAMKVTLVGELSEQPLGTATLDFADNEIEPGTGTLRLRARVNARDSGLLPGAFVRVRLAHPKAGTTLLVPDAAIGTDQGRHHVLVVDEEDTVQYRAVQLGDRHGDLRAVIGGVQAGERVVASGLMRIKPGMKVRAAERAANAG
ncbi:efflux RND transporter periplasmic adaptor subunit [Hydrogenophaga sp.]|uniref:efflux RND transporter periplasmic adaptor subunit n=1 Tax=Hydrogenophaga sp. TaxID=1904254 RepID=UPI0025BC41FE|nr:efflux RND transporter periplasmic adaptor subunit [Hydrogenophaga sp.]